MSQNSYVNSISLQSQESICSKFAHDNNLKVKSVYKEVHSAFHKTPTVLSSVINLNKCDILISDISRFSRSVVVGLEMAETALKNKNRIVFIQEKFICSSSDDFIKLTQYLKKTEDESKTIGIRIKKSRKYLIDNGMHAGGSAPYGYDIIERKPVENVREKEILHFIKLCQQSNISSDDLNQIMLKIANTKIYVPIACYDKYGNLVTKITERLNNKEIADMLNSYNVHKRGRIWTASMIKTALKSNAKQISNNEQIRNAKKTKLEPGEKLINWDNMKMEIEQINTNEPKNKRSKHETKENTAPMVNDTVNQLNEPNRRSNRLNANTSFEFNNYDMQLSRDVFDNDVNDIMHDVQLFNQFMQFRKMMNK